MRERLPPSVRHGLGSAGIRRGMDGRNTATKFQRLEAGPSAAGNQRKVVADARAGAAQEQQAVEARSAASPEPAPAAAPPTIAVVPGG